jgi:hypothetical protein
MGGIVFGACLGPMFAYIMVSILLPFVNLKGSSIGLIFGQLVNVWLSVGSAIVAQVSNFYSGSNIALGFKPYYNFIFIVSHVICERKEPKYRLAYKNTVGDHIAPKQSTKNRA